MSQPPPSRLSKEETERGLARVIQEGIAAQTMESLTTGVFLVGVALHLGASNFVIGLLGAMTFPGHLFQLPAILIVERYRNRRKIVGYTCYVARSFLLVVAAAPFIEDKDLALSLVVLGISLRYMLGAAANCAWNSWMRDLVPEPLLGRFFSRRMFYMTGIATLFSLGAGFLIDWWQRYYYDQQVFVYSVLYTAGFVAGMISASLVLTIPHPPMPEREVRQYERGFSFAHLKLPFQNDNFRKLMNFLIAWNFAINLASPFITVYMLTLLEYDMVFVVSVTILSQMVYVCALRVWGHYSDRYSNKTVLSICGPVFILCIFLWTFTTFPDRHFLTTPMVIGLHIFMGMANAGVTLSTGNIALKLAPREEATSFLAVNSLLSSLAAGLAPLFGGGLADYFADKTLDLTLHWKGSGEDLLINTLYFSHWDFFFFLAFLLGLYALRKLALVKEEGEVEEHIVIREIMMDTGKLLRSLSSVAGLRDLTMAPMAVMVNLAKRRGRRKRPKNK